MPKLQTQLPLSIAGQGFAIVQRASECQDQQPAGSFGRCAPGLHQEEPNAETAITSPLLQSFHFWAFLQIRLPFAWDDNLWPVKRSRGLLEQLDPRVKLSLIEDKDLRCDKPKRETNHQRAKRESYWRSVHFYHMYTCVRRRAATLPSRDFGVPLARPSVLPRSR